MYSEEIEQIRTELNAFLAGEDRAYTTLHEEPDNTITLETEHVFGTSVAHEGDAATDTTQGGYLHVLQRAKTGIQKMQRVKEDFYPSGPSTIPVVDDTPTGLGMAFETERSFDKTELQQMLEAVPGDWYAAPVQCWIVRRVVPELDIGYKLEQGGDVLSVSLLDDGASTYLHVNAADAAEAYEAVLDASEDIAAYLDDQLQADDKAPQHP